MEVAQMVEKEHKILLRDIRKYIGEIEKISSSKGQYKIVPSDFFQETTYISEQNKELSCYNITRKGCDFIGDKLTGQKGTEFTVLYVNRFHELEEGNLTNSLISTLNTISQSMVDIKNDFDSRLSKLEDKYKLLEEYFDISRGALYKNILLEIENVYGIDTQQVCADYLYKKNLSSCYPLEPYEFSSKYRNIIELIELIVNSKLNEYKIVPEDDPIASTKHITIFS